MMMLKCQMFVLEAVMYILRTTITGINKLKKAIA